MGLDSAEKVWKKDETAALIALFESERSLYDTKDKNYNDEQKRHDGYERIRQVMLRIRPGCTVADIKSRIKYLRTQYASELLRRNISIESGLCTVDTYKPVMWCFGLLQFLDDFLLTKKNTSKVNTSEVERSEELDTEDNQNARITGTSTPSKRNSTSHNVQRSEEPDTEDNQKAKVTVTSTSKRNSTSHNDVNNHCDVPEESGDLHVTEENSRKKRKLDTPSSSESTMDLPEKISAQTSFDREDIFGQYVASEMRALRDNPLLYLQTKQSILEILTSANFELINPE